MVCSVGVLLLYYGVIVPRSGRLETESFLRLPICERTACALARVALHASHRIHRRNFYVRPPHVRARSTRAAGVSARCARAGRSWRCPARRSYCWRTPVMFGAWAITMRRLWIPWLLVGVIAAVARLARLRGESAAAQLDHRGQCRLRILLDRVRSDASAALSPSLLPRSRRCAPRHRMRSRKCFAGNVRRMVLGGCGAASARNDRSHRRRSVPRLRRRLSESVVSVRHPARGRGKSCDREISSAFAVTAK